MREVIPLTQLLKNLKINCNAVNTLPEVHCEVFKDNQSCVAVAEQKKPPARTKHIAIKFHHFRSLVDKKIIRIRCIDTKK